MGVLDRDAQVQGGVSPLSITWVVPPLACHGTIESISRGVVVIETRAVVHVSRRVYVAVISRRVYVAVISRGVCKP